MTEDDLRELEGNQRRANPHRLDCKCVLCQEQLAEKVRRTLLAERTALRLEAEIEKACTNILIQDGWDALKTNPVSRRSRGAGFGEPGMADHLYIRYLHGDRIELQCSDAITRKIILKRPAAEVMWIEFKRRTESGADTKAAAHQKEWHERKRRKGALVLMAGEDFPATVEGFCNWYENSGLKRG